eukprot:GHVS01064827.1.p1 GENE.GHVS01064827.1~~GHVS01064827.1.p1  ORF type:complete len:556 (-),score=111.17 GHVS01064827.1:448-2115(-)
MEHEDRRDLFDGGEQDSGHSLSQNAGAVKKLFRVLKDNQPQPSHNRTTSAEGNVVTSGMSIVARPLWIGLLMLAFLLLLFCFIGTIITLSYLIPNDSSRGDASTASPAARGQEAPLVMAPLPLLWALPMEYFQHVSSVLLRMSPTQEELYRVSAVRRDSERNITRLFLATNHQLIVSPDVGLLHDSSFPVDGSVGVVARWNFNILWREIYEEQYGQLLDEDITSGDRFDELIAELAQPFQPGLSGSSSTTPSSIAHTSSSHLFPTDDTTVGSSLLTDEPLRPTSGGGGAYPTIPSPPPPPSSFPLLRRPLPSPGPTPPSAMGLPAGEVSAAEAVAGALEVLQGFPDPPVDEDEPIHLTAPSALVGAEEPIHLTAPSALVGEEEPIHLTAPSALVGEQDALAEDGIMRLEETTADMSSAQLWDDSVLFGAPVMSGGTSRSESSSRRDRRGAGGSRSLLGLVDDLFQLKMSLISGTLRKTASKVDKLAGLGGAFLTPAINWSKPFPALHSPLIAPFSYYGSSDSSPYWHFHHSPPHAYTNSAGILGRREASSLLLGQ